MIRRCDVSGGSGQCWGWGGAGKSDRIVLSNAKANYLSNANLAKLRHAFVASKHAWKDSGELCCFLRAGGVDGGFEKRRKTEKGGGKKEGRKEGTSTPEAEISRNDVTTRKR